ncbi:PA2169 family four-helix-bundle protein [Limimaricola sp. G21655-S1]|uniref:PA2169 family four-helix-bundle protein n=1 Tax=unclassified Limimaricola TaxID=2626459 RepID=UPI0022B047E4|nr:PA2169 family four-helix-bundle protein [Limimaricola sp. G21655-S1]MCZ4259318.1 PA2169 family four-helix-bundle protein [Limimaricola sp. G21655-S1]
MADHLDTLKKLHTRVIDSRDGYKHSREEVKDERGFVGFFDRRIAEREQFHTVIHRQLGAEGVEVSESGSTAAAAHRGWLSLKDSLTGDDEAVYDEIINGEEQLLKLYDEAIEATAGKPEWSFLATQRADVEKALSEARSEKMRHAA